MKQKNMKSGTFEGVTYKGVATWREATPLPYFPNLWERMGHKLGIHQWTNDNTECVMCGKKKA